MTLFNSDNYVAVKEFDDHPAMASAKHKVIQDKKAGKRTEQQRVKKLSKPSRTGEVKCPCCYHKFNPLKVKAKDPLEEDVDELMEGGQR